MRMLLQIGLVSFGSVVGGLARWGVTVLSVQLPGRSFPWGTFFINILGSFLLGWFMTWLAKSFHPTEEAWLQAEDLRLLVAVGFTGAFTTFSTYEYESHCMLRDGETGIGLAYLILSVVLGLLAVRAGVWMGR
jgi:fluoride exporter